MKRFFIFCIGLLLLGLTSCRTYKTCPTYAKSDLTKKAILASEKNITTQNN